MQDQYAWTAYGQCEYAPWEKMIFCGGARESFCHVKFFDGWAKGANGTEGVVFTTVFCVRVCVCVCNFVCNCVCVQFCMWLRLYIRAQTRWEPEKEVDDQ